MHFGPDDIHCGAVFLPLLMIRFESLSNVHWAAEAAAAAREWTVCSSKRRSFFLNSEERCCCCCCYFFPTSLCFSRSRKITAFSSVALFPRLSVCLSVCTYVCLREWESATVGRASGMRRRPSLLSSVCPYKGGVKKPFLLVRYEK